MQPLERLAIVLQTIFALVCGVGIGLLVWSQLPWWFSGPEEEFFFWRLVLIGLTFIALPISIFGPAIRRRLRARRRGAGSC